MIVGSGLFYLVHLDTKKLQELTFYVAQNDGSVLLSCTTTLALGLKQPPTRLDYLPLIQVVFGVGWIRDVCMGCSHITTNLGSHRAQTQRV